MAPNYHHTLKEKMSGHQPVMGCALFTTLNVSFFIFPYPNIYRGEKGPVKEAASINPRNATNGNMRLLDVLQTPECEI